MKDSYRSIFKATALFGGVQLYSVLLSLVRVKVVAVLLGSSGAGVLSLLTNTLALLGTFTGLGVDKGVVRELAQSCLPEKQAAMVTTARHWNLVAGIFGFLVLLFMAPWLSEWCFQTSEYDWGFRFLSIALLFDTLTRGQLAILQGLKHLTSLARANLLGTTIGLLVSLPLYSLIGANGIIPAMILCSITTFIVIFFVYRKQHITATPLSFQQRFSSGNELIRIGITLTLGTILSSLTTYLFSLYVSNHDGVAMVGLYQSGFSIIDKCVGMVFLAMTADYYPRLSAHYENNIQLSQLASQQSIIGLLIIFPIICIFIPASPLIVRILLSEEFISTLPLLLWAILGVTSKVISWSLGFVLLAKGRMKLFLGIETFDAIFVLASYICGYELMGLEGIGIAYCTCQIIYAIIMVTVVFIATKVKLNNEIVPTLLYSNLVILSIWGGRILFVESHPILYSMIAGGGIIASITYSIYQLHRKVNLIHLLNRRR